MKIALLICCVCYLFSFKAQTGVTLPTINISPQFVANLGPANNETSGLVYHHDTLFSINDSGNAPAIFAIDPVTGNTMQTWAFLNAQNLDWEALTASSSKVFIGDIGNNMGNRQFFDIYQVDFVEMSLTDTLPTSKQTFYYPDQPIGPLPMNGHNFDAEAMAWKNDSLHIFSKNWVNLWTKHYVLPAIWQDTIAATLVDSFQVNGLITDAAYDSANNQIFLLGYQQQASGLYNTFMWMFWDFQNEIFNGTRRRLELGSTLSLAQTEGICITGAYKGLISGEQINTVITIPPKIHSWDVAQLMSAKVEAAPLGVYFAENTLYLPDGFSEVLSLIDTNRKVVLQTQKGKRSYNLERLAPGTYYLLAHDWTYKWLKNN
ncbi:MAG: hypothetical protein ACKOWX_00965 [Flavobacteriales bacterium]